MMKNFEQRKAEIFRRSAERIRQKKKIRNRALRCCALLVAFSAVLFAATLLTKQPAKNLSAAKKSTAAALDSYILMEVQELTHEQQNCRQFQSPAVLNEMADCLEAFGFSSATPAAPNAAELQDFVSSTASTDANRQQTKSAGEVARCQITLTQKNGVQTVYTLTGNVFKNTQTNQALILSNEQSSRLKALLQLP